MEATRETSPEVPERTAPRTVLIDCDPGIDDAFALLLAIASPNVHLVGVTTVAGNRPLSDVTRNAQDLLGFYGGQEIPVAAGEAKPLVREPVTAQSHGEKGLGGHELPRSSIEFTSVDGVGFLIDSVMNRPPETVTIIAIGPLTNLARALQREPRLSRQVAEVVVMGGAHNAGNMSPVAEFNFFADPEAANEVLQAGWPVTLLPLNLTWQSAVPAQVLRQIHEHPGPIADALYDWLCFYAEGEFTPDEDGPSLHDACAVACVIDPTLITTVPAFAAVETAGQWTYGESVIDLMGHFRRPPNVRFGMTLDRGRFWALVLDALRDMNSVPGRQIDVRPVGPDLIGRKRRAAPSSVLAIPAMFNQVRVPWPAGPSTAQPVLRGP